MMLMRGMGVSYLGRRMAERVYRIVWERGFDDRMATPVTLDNPLNVPPHLEYLDVKTTREIRAAATRMDGTDETYVTSPDARLHA